MQHSLVPITTIELNPNQLDNNGAIICGDTVQYFEFGEITGLRQKGSGQRLQKQVNNGSNNKMSIKRRYEMKWMIIIFKSINVIKQMRC